MGAIELLARSSDDVEQRVISLCVFAAIVFFVILVKVISSVSPEVMARKIRELQARRPVRTTMPAAYEAPIYAQLVETAPPQAPAKKRKKRRLAPTSALTAPSRPAHVKSVAQAGEVTPAPDAIDFAQAVVFAEILAPPLALRRGRTGLLRSASWTP